MPAVFVIAVFVIAGVEAFNVANSNSGSRPAAPFQAIFVWAVWFFPLTAVGTFLTLLAYLLVLPIFALITVLLILQWLPHL